MHDQTLSDAQFDDDDERDLRPGFDLRELLQLHPRLLLAAMIAAVLMLPVGLILAAIGIGVLKVSGGAAHDTSLVVGIAGFVVADFWGGGLVAAITRARAPQVAVAWVLARLVVLGLIALVATGMAKFLPVQLIFAAPAAWAGARAARKQAALRRQIKAERDAARPTATPVADAPR